MKTLRAWSAPLLVSFLAFAWPLGAYLLDSINVLEYHPTLQLWVPAEGTSQRWRTEGFATTVFGEGGIQPPDWKQLPRPLVALWGDSFVEAWQVPAEQRLEAQVGARLAARGTRAGCLAIAMHGWGLASYAPLRPRFHALVPDIALDVVVVNEDDALLGEVYDYGKPPPLARWRAPLRALGLDALWVLMRDARDAARGLRLRPGPAPAEPPPAVPPPAASPGSPGAPTPEPLLAVLRAIRDASPTPLVLVYVPGVPRIGGDRVLQSTAATQAMSERLARLCGQLALGYLDAGPALVASYQRTGLLPNGFLNSVPGLGHLNARGHAAVAEALAPVIASRLDALP